MYPSRWQLQSDRAFDPIATALYTLRARLASASPPRYFRTASCRFVALARCARGLLRGARSTPPLVGRLSHFVDNLWVRSASRGVKRRRRPRGHGGLGLLRGLRRRSNCRSLPSRAVVSRTSASVSFIGTGTFPSRRASLAAPSSRVFSRAPAGRVGQRSPVRAIIAPELALRVVG